MLTDADGQLRWASVSDQRAQVLEDNQEVFAAGPCAEAFNTNRSAVMHDATMERRWGEITLTFVEVQIRSGLSVPVELGGGPIGTLDVYASDPRGWDDTDHLRRAARSSGRKLSAVASEVAAGLPLPRGRTRPTPTPTEQPTSNAGDPQHEA